MEVPPAQKVSMTVFVLKSVFTHNLYLPFVGHSCVCLFLEVFFGNYTYLRCSIKIEKATFALSDVPEIGPDERGW